VGDLLLGSHIGKQSSVKNNKCVTMLSLETVCVGIMMSREALDLTRDKLL
jgi:hypothetical protein